MPRNAFSTNVPSYHKISKDGNGRSAVETLNAEYGGGFDIVLRPSVVQLNGQDTVKDYAVVRTGDGNPEDIFGYVTERFVPVQVQDFAAKFDEMVGKPVDRFGIFDKGRSAFISWQMPKIEINGRNEVS